MRALPSKLQVRAKSTCFLFVAAGDHKLHDLQYRCRCESGNFSFHTHTLTPALLLVQSSPPPSKVSQ